MSEKCANCGSDRKEVRLHGCEYMWHNGAKNPDPISSEELERMWESVRKQLSGDYGPAPDFDSLRAEFSRRGEELNYLRAREAILKKVLDTSLAIAYAEESELPGLYFALGSLYGELMKLEGEQHREPV